MKYLRLFENYKSLDDIIFLQYGGKGFKAPKFVYHTTHISNLENIKKEGLKTSNSRQHFFKGGIYLAYSKVAARRYMWRKDTEWALIEIPFINLDTNHMYPDDWELFDMISDEWPEIQDFLDLDIGRNWNIKSPWVKKVWNTLDYRHSLAICSQMVYTKDITPDQFSNITIEKT